MKNNIFILILLFAFVRLNSQDKVYTIEVIQIDSVFSIKKVKSFKSEYADSNSIRRVLRTHLSSLHDNGYITASLDGLTFDSTSVKAQLNRGLRYSWGVFRLDSMDSFMLRRLGIKPKYFQYQTLRFSKLNKVKEKIIHYYENSGYPFASLELKEIRINENEIEGVLSLEKNELFIIKDVVIKGDAVISKKYFTNYTGIIPETIYIEDKIANIGKRIIELDFINEVKPSEVEFREGEAFIYTYLENKKANSFSGILGFIPNSKLNNKLVLTGEVNLFLVNSFKRGEDIAFEWKKSGLSSQELNLKFVYPYVFSLPLAIDVEFDLFKKDSTYLTVHTNLGMRYLFEGENYLKTYIKNKNASIISAWGLESLTVLPPYADIKTSLFGLEYFFSNLDYKHNPRKGISLLLYSGVGQRKIIKHSKIPEIVYQNLDLKSNQLDAGCDISMYKLLSKRSVLKLQNKSGYLNNPELFDNELFRLGGLKTIRGFDENEMLASLYSILTLEYRFLFEQNSNLFLFWDGGYYEKSTHQDFVSDFPFGFGAGINFETKAGIFSLNYALGKQFDNPIQFRSAKVHFGFISRF